MPSHHSREGPTPPPCPVSPARARLCQTPLGHAKLISLDEEGGLPGENETQEGADQNEHLVKHRRLGPLYGSVEVILGREERTHQLRKAESKVLLQVPTAVLLAPAVPPPHEGQPRIWPLKRDVYFCEQVWALLPGETARGNGWNISSG